MNHRNDILLHPVGYTRGLGSVNHTIIGSDILVGDAITFFEQYCGSSKYDLRRWRLAWKYLSRCDLRLPVYLSNHHVNYEMYCAGFEPVYSIDRTVSFWDPLEAMALCLLGPMCAPAASQALRPGASPLREHGALWQPIPVAQKQGWLSVKLLDVIGVHRVYPFAPIIRVGTSGPNLDGKVCRAWMRSDGLAYPIGGYRGKYVLDSVPLFDVYSSYGYRVLPGDLVDLVPDYLDL